MTLFSFLCQFGSTFFCRNVVIEEEKCTRNNEESRNADQFVMRRTGEFPQANDSGTHNIALHNKVDSISEREPKIK